MRRFTVLPLALVLGGCYSYSSVTLDAVPQGSRVSADLTTRGAADNETRLGNDVMLVEGTLVGVRGDSIVVEVSRTRNRGGSWVHWNGEQVALSQDAIATFRQRKFSIGRTALVTAGAAAVIITTLGTDLLGTGDDGRDPTDPVTKPKPGDQ